MVKNFEEFVNEIWSKSVERNLNDEKRLEDGHKYKTSLGEVIEINCSNIEVEKCIKKYLNNSSEDGGILFEIDEYTEDSYTSFKIGYDIDDEPVSITFTKYEEIKDEYESISYDDYETIIGCIANSIKNTVGDKSIIIFNDDAYVILVNEDEMNTLCENDEDRFDDGSGYNRLLDKLIDFTGKSYNTEFEWFNGVSGMGEEPCYIAIKINEWFIHNFNKLCIFISKEWDNLINLSYDEDE